MKIGIHGINLNDKKKKVLSNLIKVINKNKIGVLYSKKLSKNLGIKNIKTYNKTSITELDFIISFGGDGTLLETVTHIENTGKHILGINIGKLGFLSEVLPEPVTAQETITLLFIKNICSILF